MWTRVQPRPCSCEIGPTLKTVLKVHYFYHCFGGNKQEIIIIIIYCEIDKWLFSRRKCSKGIETFFYTCLLEVFNLDLIRNPS